VIFYASKYQIIFFGYLCMAFISLVVETMIVVPIIWFVILFLSLVAY